MPGGENTLFRPARAFGAPQTTCTGSPVTGIDHADAQPVRVGMLLGRDDLRDDERRERLGLVLDCLDLEPDHGQLVDDLVSAPSVSRCSLSQERVNFMDVTRCPKIEHGNSRNTRS